MSTGLITTFQKWNLKNKKYKILDKEPNSEYFKIYGFSNKEYSKGRHNFIVYGSNKLVQNSEIFIEIEDSIGNPIKCNGVKSKITEPGWIVWFEIDDRLYNGIATIYAAGTAKGYSEKVGGLNNLNVIWKSDIVINKNIKNSSTPVFINYPQIDSISENIDNGNSYAIIRLSNLEVYSGKLNSIEVYYQILNNTSLTSNNLIINGHFAAEGFKNNIIHPLGWEVENNNWIKSEINGELDIDHPTSLYFSSPTGSNENIYTLSQKTPFSVYSGSYYLKFQGRINENISSSMPGYNSYNVNFSLYKQNEYDEEYSFWYNIATIYSGSNLNDNPDLDNNWNQFLYEFNLNNENAINTKLIISCLPPPSYRIDLDNIILYRKFERKKNNLLEEIGHFRGNNKNNYFKGWNQVNLNTLSFKDVEGNWQIDSNSPFDSDKNSFSLKGPNRPESFPTVPYVNIITSEPFYVFPEEYKLNIDSKCSNVFYWYRARLLKYNSITGGYEIWKTEENKAIENWTTNEFTFDLSNEEELINKIKLEIVFNNYPRITPPADPAYNPPATPNPNKKNYLTVDNINFYRNTYFNQTIENWKLLGVDTIDDEIVKTYSTSYLMPNQINNDIVSFKILLKDDTGEYINSFDNNLLQLYSNYHEFIGFETGSSGGNIISSGSYINWPKWYLKKSNDTIYTGSYLVDTSDNEVTLTIPSNLPTGSVLEFKDYKGTWTKNNFTLNSTIQFKYKGRIADCFICDIDDTRIKVNYNGEYIEVS